MTDHIILSINDRIDARLASADRKRGFLVLDGVATDSMAMADRISRAFTVFARKGLVPGDRLAILSRSVLDIATLMLAGIRYGLAVINLNPEISGRDSVIAFEACKPAHLVVDRIILDRVVVPANVAVTVVEPVENVARTGAFGFLRRRRVGEAVAGWAAELAGAVPGSPPASAGSNATAMMLLTSGTTSAPKVVELTNANLSAQVDAFIQVFDYDVDSRILNPLPLHFTDGMLHGPIIAFLTGATLHRPTAFDFRQFEDLVHGIWRDRITHLIVVPALLALLDRLGDAFGDAFAGPDFRYIRSSGDVLPEALWQNVQTRFGVRVANTYGMSETVCEATYAGPAADTLRVGTIGKPVGCELRIRAEENADAPPGTVGELQVRGPIVMKGYLDQPDLTAAAFEEGWLRTGDLAILDADGFVRIVGRAKSLIISGGVNIQPQDVSDCLLAHPGVAEAATVGLPHTLWGEQVTSAVRLRDGVNLTPQDLIAHCAASISAHKVPKVITILPELPRNAAGKVIVDELRRQLRALDTSIGSASEGDTAAIILGLAAQVFALSPDRLHLTSTPATTQGWDSLAHLNFVMAIEDRFGFKMSAGEVLRIDGLSEAVQIVRTKMDNSGAKDSPANG